MLSVARMDFWMTFSGCDILPDFLVVFGASISRGCTFFSLRPEDSPTPLGASANFVNSLIVLLRIGVSLV